MGGKMPGAQPPKAGRYQDGQLILMFEDAGRYRRRPTPWEENYGRLEVVRSGDFTIRNVEPRGPGVYGCTVDASEIKTTIYVAEEPRSWAQEQRATEPHRRSRPLYQSLSLAQMERLPTVNSPLIVSRPYVPPARAMHMTDARVLVVSRAELSTALQEVLRFIGVDPRDVRGAEAHLSRMAPR